MLCREIYVTQTGPIKIVFTYFMCQIKQIN